MSRGRNPCPLSALCPPQLVELHRQSSEGTPCHPSASRKSQQINSWLSAWYHQQNLGFFSSCIHLQETRPPGTDVVHQQGEKELSAKESRADQKSFNLDFKEKNKIIRKKDNIRLTSLAKWHTSF